MSTNSQNNSYLLDEVVSAIAFESFQQEPLMVPSLFDIRASGRRRERTASFSGLSEFETKAELAAATEDQVENQFEKDFTHVAYAKKVPIARELIDDSEFGLVEDIGRQIGVMAAYTIENKCASVLRGAFGATLAEDGLSLCNGAHLNAAGGNSQSNSGTTALSMTSVKTTRTAMRKFLNYNGDLAGVRPDSLIIPTDLEESAWEIVNSTGGRPDNANNAANMYAGMFKLFVWDFLSTGVSGGDVNNWFMADSRLMMQNQIMYLRTPLEIFGDGNLFTGTRNIGGYMRFSYGVRDWRWVYGHAVA
jgi:hypothetical protein